MEGALTKMSSRKGSADITNFPEYIGKFSLYTHSICSEFNNAQRLIAAFFYCLIMSDDTAAVDLLNDEADIAQLGSTFLTVWFNDDFKFLRKDVAKALHTLAGMVANEKISFSSPVVSVISNLEVKYSLRGHFLQYIRIWNQRHSKSNSLMSLDNLESNIVRNDTNTMVGLAVENNKITASRDSLNFFTDTSFYKDSEVIALLEKALSIDSSVMIEDLAKSGVDLLSFKDYDGYSYIHRAAEEGSIAVLQALLNINKDVNKKEGPFFMTPLHMASYNGHMPVVQLLLERGAFLDEVDQFGQTPLHMAAEIGNAEIVAALCVAGANVNLEDNDNRTPLYSASDNGKREVVAVLCAAGAVWRDGDVNTLIEKALDRNSAEMITSLAASGVDVTLLKNKDDYTYIQRAAWEGKVAIVNAFLDVGADINKEGTFRWTALHTASYKGQLPVVQLLLERGAAVNVDDDFGQTPLHLAAEVGHVEIVSDLCEAGADVNKEDNDNKTPLYTAADNGQTEVMAVLYAAGSVWRDDDINKLFKKALNNDSPDVIQVLAALGVNLLSLENSDGYSYLFQAAWEGKLAVLNALLDLGGDINKKEGPMFLTALHVASYTGRWPVIQLLLERGAAVNVVNDSGQSPLHLAVLNGHAEVATALLKVGAVWRESEINSLLEKALDTDSAGIIAALAETGVELMSLKNENGETYWYQAASDGKAAVVQIYLDLGVDIHTKSKNNNWTALHVASFNGHLPVVQLLLKRGASVYEVDDYQKTPLHLAVTKGRLEIIHVLCNSGANVNAGDKEGRTPLHLAAESGDIEVIRELCARGAALH